MHQIALSAPQTPAIWGPTFKGEEGGSRGMGEKRGGRRGRERGGEGREEGKGKRRGRERGGEGREEGKGKRRGRGGKKR